jgi:hypothetical protein
MWSTTLQRSSELPFLFRFAGEKGWHGKPATRMSQGGSRTPSWQTSPNKRKPGKSAAKTKRAGRATSQAKASRKDNFTLREFSKAAARWHTPMPLQMEPTAKTSLPPAMPELATDPLPAFAQRATEAQIGAPPAASAAPARRRRFAGGTGMTPPRTQGSGKLNA